MPVPEVKNGYLPYSPLPETQGGPRFLKMAWTDAERFRQ